MGAAVGRDVTGAGWIGERVRPERVLVPRPAVCVGVRWGASSERVWCRLLWHVRGHAQRVSVRALHR
jgi:hypothetical protein